MSDALDNVLKYIDECLHHQTGPRFTSPQLSDVSGIGALVEKGSALSSDVLAKLKTLEESIGKLVKKLTGSDYDELDVLMRKNLFYTEYIQRLLTVTKFVQDTLFTPGQQSYDQLSEVYQKNPTLQDAVQTISFMSIDGSNPIKVAMSADAAKSLTTFKKYRDIVDGYLQHFLFVEAFVKRLLFGDKNTDAVELEKLIKDVEKKYDEWEEEYKPTPTSDTVKAIIEHVQEMSVDNETRSDILIDYLSRTFPSNTFHVFVFNEPTHVSDYVAYALDGKMSKYSRPGKCSVVVCTSADYQNFTAEELRDLRRVVRTVDSIDLGDTKFENIPQKYMEEFDKLVGQKHGSFSLIRDTQQLATRVAPVRAGRAPGWSTKKSARGSDGNTYSYTLLAAFK